MKHKREIGKAYAFFDCNASKGEIEAELPIIRSLSRTPSKLELSLKEVKNLGKNREVDSDLLKYVGEKEIYPTFPSRFKDLMETAKPIKMTDLKYMIEAKYPDGTNEDTANELGDVMSGIYAEYGNDEPFNVAVVAKIDGEFLFKE